MGGLQKNKTYTKTKQSSSFYTHSMRCRRKHKRGSSLLMSFDSITLRRWCVVHARQTTIGWVRYAKANTHCGYWFFSTCFLFLNWYVLPSSSSFTYQQSAVHDVRSDTTCLTTAFVVVTLSIFALFLVKNISMCSA